MAAEESVSKSELPREEQPFNNQMGIPVQQYTISIDIVPDYRLYLVSSCTKQYPVVAIVEVKQKSHFNDRAICQAIGYYLASRADVSTENPFFVVAPWD